MYRRQNQNLKTNLNSDMILEEHPIIFRDVLDTIQELYFDHREGKDISKRLQELFDLTMKNPSYK